MNTDKFSRIVPVHKIRRFGKLPGYEIPDLTAIQTQSYKAFLQENKLPNERENIGLEAILREIFPINNYDKTIRLEYVYYELEKPRYEPDECRQLHLTYGKPLNVRLRLVKESGTTEEDVYLGDLPIMLGGGEFIINGVERVIVNQLYRSPGIDFFNDVATERRMVSCRIIPERGSWIELRISRKETVIVRIDQSRKLPVMMLLRAMSPELSTNTDILRAFYKTQVIRVEGGAAVSKIEGKVTVTDVTYPLLSDRGGEIILECGQTITKSKAETICTSGIKKIEVMDDPKNKLLLNSLEEDKTESHEKAMIRIYQRLRPGNLPQLDRAKDMFRAKFYDKNRYRLGHIGRFRINRKLGTDTSLDEMSLRPDDIIQAVLYLNRLWCGDWTAEVDDIDHLGNRRLRTIDELAGEELRKGFLKLRRTAQERMNLRGGEDITPRQVINWKSISAAIEYFFGHGELSQIIDQTNPLSMLTHERQLSVFGPGGLNRKRVGFDARNVHSSYYGRICPIETPVGSNVGLISSLSIYSGVDEFGFLVSPYRRVKNGVITDEIEWLRADQEHEAMLIPADVLIDGRKIMPDPVTGKVIVRIHGNYEPVSVEEIEYMDIAPNQMIGVAAGLIPFLEHNNVRAAVTGTNMQKQAVPLLIPEPPLVGTGLERDVAYNSSLVLKAKRSGIVTYMDSLKVVIANKDDDYIDEYELRKFAGLNERTCQNQTPTVSIGQEVKAGDFICDGAGICNGVLSLGRNVLVAFMSWEGCNYEKAIVISEDLLKKDTFTSIHIEEFEVEIRDTKLGQEEFTREVPNVGERALRYLDDQGIVRVGTYVRPGDIIVGKVTPKSKTELTPEEKLLHSIFGRAAEDVKNESLEVPPGVEGIVIGTQKIATRMSLNEEQRREFEMECIRVEEEGNQKIGEVFGKMIADMEVALDGPVVDVDGNQITVDLKDKYFIYHVRKFRLHNIEIKDNKVRATIEKVYNKAWPVVEAAIDLRDRRLNSLKRGDELKRGILQMAKVYIATKRPITVGDKIADRHGNHGVIAKILRREDMPFLSDGTPVDMILNPQRVIERMNLGHVFETHLGWAAAKLGYRAITPVFNGASEETVNDCLEMAGLPRHGKVQLWDGRTGELLDQETTVGYLYMQKLRHLVDDKVHARSTGPYSLITQQPPDEKTRFGGQRFGEMEVWALEAYGAAYTLQELLTVKSDDVKGRTKIDESMVKGENSLEANIPASFDVLMRELQGLGLNIRLEKRENDDSLNKKQ